MKLWKCLGLRRSFLTVSISSSSLPLFSQLRNGFYGYPSARAHITTACPTHDLGASVVSAMLLLYLAPDPTSRQEITLAALELFRVCLVSPDSLRIL